jgi:hypothetical protein
MATDFVTDETDVLCLSASSALTSVATPAIAATTNIATRTQTCPLLITTPSHQCIALLLSIPIWNTSQRKEVVLALSSAKSSHCPKKNISGIIFWNLQNCWAIARAYPGFTPL